MKKLLSLAICAAVLAPAASAMALVEGVPYTKCVNGIVVSNLTFFYNDNLFRQCVYTAEEVSLTALFSLQSDWYEAKAKDYFSCFAINRTLNFPTLVNSEGPCIGQWGIPSDWCTFTGGENPWGISGLLCTDLSPVAWPTTIDLI